MSKKKILGISIPLPKKKNTPQTLYSLPLMTSTGVSEALAVLCKYEPHSLTSNKHEKALPNTATSNKEKTKRSKKTETKPRTQVITESLFPTEPNGGTQEINEWQCALFKVKAVGDNNGNTLFKLTDKKRVYGISKLVINNPRETIVLDYGRKNTEQPTNKKHSPQKQTSNTYPTIQVFPRKKTWGIMKKLLGKNKEKNTVEYVPNNHNNKGKKTEKDLLPSNVKTTDQSFQAIMMNATCEYKILDEQKNKKTKETIGLEEKEKIIECTANSIP